MRGGKRQGAGRKPRFGQYKETATMRIPVQLKQEIIAFIEHLCRKGTQVEKDYVAQSKGNEIHRENDNVTLSKERVFQAKQILDQSLNLKANAGGAIKNEIRKAMNILEL